ncbi:hypothetical protein AX17_003240 [Amanita inopinata Kibby_2008]|nr:hypothetical protein AX17_003240 [Amanita inopinata Kibby_2008]
MRLTAVIVSAFLLVGNVVAASSNYGEYSFVTRDYNLDARGFTGGSGRKTPSDQHELWRRSGGDCSEKYGPPVSMSAKECHKIQGVGWKRGTTGGTCYKPREIKDWTVVGRCYPKPKVRPLPPTPRPLSPPLRPLPLTPRL